MFYLFVCWGRGRWDSDSAIAGEILIVFSEFFVMNLLLQFIIQVHVKRVLVPILYAGSHVVL